MKHLITLFLGLLLGLSLWGQAGRVKQLAPGEGSSFVDGIVAPVDTNKLWLDGGENGIPKLWNPYTGQYDPVKFDFEVDSIGQILKGKFPSGSQITIKETINRPSFRYWIQDTPVSGYDTDTIAVVPDKGGKYAVIQPENSRLNLSWFTSGYDTVDDTKVLVALGKYLQYSDAATVFVPKGRFNIAKSLSTYNNQVKIYGNLEGAGRDSSFLYAEGIDTMVTGDNKMIQLMNSNTTLSGLGFYVNGDPLYTEASKAITVIGLAAYDMVVEHCHFKEMTVGSSNTAGNAYLSQFVAQNSFRYTTTTLDTVFPGDNVDVRVADSDFFTRYNQVVIYDSGSGKGDTTSIVNVFIQSDSIRLFRITDTIPAGAEFKVPAFGGSRTVVKDNIFENMYEGCGTRMVAQELWFERNIFRNNGINTNQHDTYNQSGVQFYYNNWFEGGGSYGIGDANKQEGRWSGGMIIMGNTFRNKPLGVQLVLQSNPVTHYSSGLPIGYNGNRVMQEGTIVANNIFYNSPNTPATTSVQVGGAFGGIDDESVLVGDGSILYEGNTHVGRVQTGFGSDPDHLDLTFSDNVYELNDTSSIQNAIISLPRHTKFSGNRFVSKGPDHYVITGDSIEVSELTFEQHHVTTLNEQNVALTNSVVKDSKFVIDSSFFQAQTQYAQMIAFGGGRWENNEFKYKNSTRPLMIGMSGSRMPDFVNNRFINAGVGIPNGYKNPAKTPIVKNNEGMRIWTRGQIAYPFGGIEQTSSSGELMFAETHTLTSTNPQGGDLICIGTDSTYTIATHLSDYIDGVLMTGSRFDSTIIYTSLYEGQVLRINATGNVEQGDYLVIDSTTAGKIKSQGKEPLLNTNLLVQAIEGTSEWDSGTSYVVGDIVTRNNRNYRCTYPNTNQEPAANQFSLDNYWTGSPLKVKIIRVGRVDQENIINVLNYELFPTITYTPTDSIPVDTILQSFPITSRLNGDTLRQITYTVTKAPTINLDLRVLIWNGTTYTAAFVGTIPAGQRSVTVSGLVAVAIDERIFPEILTDSGASGLDLEFKFQKP